MMTNAKNTKKTLLMSMLSLLLCVTMFIGTTFAWFTDSVSSANNIIKSGNLDVELEYWNGTEWVSVDGKSDILTNTLWEPGVTEVAYLRVANAGSLAFKYQLGINVLGETTGKNVNGDDFRLSDYILFDVIEGVNGQTGPYANREAAVEAVANGKRISAGYTKAASMVADEELYLALVVYMPTSVGNEANHDGVNKPEIKLGVNIFATQLEYEEDSFGPDYDNGAPIMNAPAAVPSEGESIILNGSAESKVTVNVPAAVLGGLDNSVTAMTVAASAPIVDTANKTVTFSTIELVDQNGEQIDISASTAKVTVTLPVNGAFADGEQVEVYHDGSFVTYATVENGQITYEVSHFCEVEIKAAEEVELEVVENVLTINTVKELITFAEDVNGGNTYAGITVVLGADMDLAGVTWTPIGTSTNIFKGNFDGNGKVIKNLSVLMAGQSNVGFFGVTHDGKIENVTVENAKVAGRTNVGVVAGQPYTTTYTNITVKGDVEVDGLAYVGAVGGKNAYANWTDITVDVEEGSYVNAYSIENGNAYRTYVGGVVGFNGEGGHTFKNITTNIDVYGSTCDVGGAFGIAHYDNVFENVTVTGNVTITHSEEDGNADEMGGIAGVWHNENGTTVTFTNCKFTGELSANVETDLYNNTIVGAAYNTNGNGTLVIDGVAYAAVNTAEELVVALENNKNVIFVDNIKVDPANMSNAYGKTGINVKNGQAIDGNGYTLDIKGAGGTWDSGINTTGGVIKNITVSGSFRGIFVNHNSTYSETVVLDNVTLENVVYTVSCDQGLNQNLVATNCTFKGWTSFAKTIGTVKFENCTFAEGSGYKYCRPYAATEFVNCNFVAGYTMDPQAAVTLEGCTLNGVAITAENYTDLVTPSNAANATVK